MAAAARVWVLAEAGLRVLLPRSTGALAALFAGAALLALSAIAAAAQSPAQPPLAPPAAEQPDVPASLDQAPPTAPPAELQTGPPAQQAEAQPVDIAAPVQGWDEALTRIEADLAKPALDEEALDELRQQLGDVQSQIADFMARERPRLHEIEARTRALGEAPKDGEPPEPAPVAEQRRDLRKALGDLTGTLKAADEAGLRSRLLAGQARDLRRELFSKRIFERGRSPLSPSLWRDIAADAPIGLARIGHMLTHWWRTPGDKGLFLGVVAAAAALLVLLSYLGQRGIAYYRNWSALEPPSQWRRAASAGRVVLFRSLPTIVAGGFLYLALDEFGLLSEASETIVISAIASLVIVATAQAVTKTALAISRPHWRLIALSDAAALRLYRLMMVLAALYGIDFFIASVNQAVFMPFSVSIGQSFISSVLFAALIIAILRVRDGGDASAPGRPIGPRSLRLPLWLVALSILVAALIGYVGLARFIAGQLIVTSTIFIVAYLLIVWVSAFGESMAEDNTVAGGWLGKTAGFDQRRREQIALPFMLLLKAAIILAAVPLVLLLWGFDWQDISGWIRQALFGFELGGVRLSVTTIVGALLIFVVGYVAAKFFQAWLDGYVMARAGVEPGVRDSIRTGVGYFGVGLALLLAISYVGLDFSNLAIVAGALSVGVGFGLQSVVNNFVSGLILLAERPVKIGDWIIVGAHEGIVRRISVRSTEIETFDRANVIVPNSMLISDVVKNWTLHNTTGRMPVPVGVHYDSDPEQVRDILLEVARQHPQVLSNPEPFVFLEDFGDSSLKFILFVYLSNVSRSFSVRTDLRIAILKAFRNKGIEIPYPQAEVHLRDLGWIKKAFAERGGGGTPPADGPMSVRDYPSESGAPGDNDNGH